MAENKVIARDIIVDYLKALKIDYLFGVPGTNEIPIIDGTKNDGPKYDWDFHTCLKS